METPEDGTKLKMTTVKGISTHKALEKYWNDNSPQGIGRVFEDTTTLMKDDPALCAQLIKDGSAD
ncbi:hypothetical protein ['Camptotheca acuminata' phytoplasma]|uniref:hypothetical protein n=1 Tax='Camptotheca acuminata' phytoplasma TaxID=3239192 RepID=UPI003519EAFA